MNRSSKPFAGLVIRLLDKLVADVFASARLRITVLYFFTGAVILIIAGTIVYSQSIRILGEFTQGISFAVTENTALPPPAPPGATAGESMNLQDAAQNQRTSETLAGTLEQDIKRMIYAVAAGMSIAIFVSAYVLAGITLRPIRRVLENKKRFIGNVSHELRTPLSIMRMSSEAALLHEADVTKQELVATMRSNMDEVERMSRILKFLLTFSEFEHRAKDLPMSPVNLSRVIQNSTQLMDISLKKKGLRVEVAKGKDLFVQGNAVALEEALLNLLKNAIRHTPAGGLIRVALKKKRYGIAELTVQDFGSGIAPQDLPNVFERFYRARANPTQGKGGAGIGLAITKEIVSLHRGTISLSSELGRGATIIIRLPSSKSPKRP